MAWESRTVMSILAESLINCNAGDNLRTGTHTKELSSIGRLNKWNTLTLREQFNLFFELVKSDGRFSSYITWLKFFKINPDGKLSPVNFRCFRNLSTGIISGYECHAQDKDFAPIGNIIEDVFQHLENLSQNGGNGVVFLPSVFGHKPLADKVLARHLIFFECDGISKEEQKDLIIELDNGGISPHCVNDSGNKSYHVYFLIHPLEPSHPDFLKWNYSQYLFSRIGGDPAVADSKSIAMRPAGFIRANRKNNETKEWEPNGKRQSLEYLNSDAIPYDVNSFIDLLSNYLKSKGISFQSWDDWSSKKESSVGRVELDLSDLDLSIRARLVGDVISDLAGVNISADSNTYGSVLRLFWGLGRLLPIDTVADLFEDAFPGVRDWRGMSKGYKQEKKKKPGIPSIKTHMGELLGIEWNFPDYFSQSISSENDFDIEKWKEKNKQKWIQLKTLSQGETVNYRYISDMPTMSLDGMGLFINSMMGTGKTTKIRKILDAYYQEVGVCAIFSRLSLGENFNASMGDRFIDPIHEKSEYNEGDDRAWLMIRWDSLLAIRIDWWQGKIILLDEVVSLFHHLLFSKTLDGQRSQVIERFFYIMKVCRGFICMDGHLTDYIVNFFKAIDHDKKIKVINNVYSGGRPPVRFFEGSYDGEKLKKNDYSGLLAHMKETLKSKPIIVFCDSRKELETLDRDFKRLGLSGFILSSRTKKSDAKAFLKNCGEWIKLNKIDYLLISPSAESGVDISGVDGYFGACYCLFFGVVLTDTQKQFMMRLRDITIPRYVWLRSHSIMLDNTDSRYKKDAVFQNILKEVNMIDSANPSAIIQVYADFVDSIPPALWELVGNYHAVAQFERFNFREAFIESVALGGYELDVCSLECDKNLGAEHKATKKAIKESECNLIATADDRFVPRPNHILSSSEKSDPLAIAALEKAKLIHSLPSIHLSDLWGDDLIKFLLYSRPNFIASRRRYILAKELDLAKLIADRRHSQASLESLRERGIAPWEIKASYRQAKAISASGIIPLIESRAPLTADSEMVGEIIKKGKSKPIWEALGRKPGADSMKWVSWLIRLLGYEVSATRYRDGDKLEWVYSLSHADFTDNKPYFDIVDSILSSQLYGGF
jgi:hypothetical protein